MSTSLYILSNNQNINTLTESWIYSITSSSLQLRSRNSSGLEIIIALKCRACTVVCTKFSAFLLRSWHVSFPKNKIMIRIILVTNRIQAYLWNRYNGSLISDNAIFTDKTKPPFSTASDIPLIFVPRLFWTLCGSC